MSYRYELSPARTLDLDMEWESSRRRLTREDALLRRLEALERQVQTLTQLLRTSGIDGLYSTQLEENRP